MSGAVAIKTVYAMFAAIFGAGLGSVIGLFISYLGVKSGVLPLSVQEDGHLDWDIPAAFFGMIAGLGAGGFLGWRLLPRLDDLRTS